MTHLLDADAAIEAVRSGTIDAAAYYDELATAFGLTIDATDPDFGTEPLLDSVAAAPGLATFVGEQTHLIWPAYFDLRRIAVQDPVPVYPHSLIWRRDNAQPALTMLRDYLGFRQPSHPRRRDLDTELGAATGTATATRRLA